MDYAGPFYYKDESRKTTKLSKCYIAIFVYFASMAVYIELATDFSIEALNVLSISFPKEDIQQPSIVIMA